jgi:hypothetical protein
MADSDQSRPPPNGPESEKRVDEFVESHLTEERLNKLWDRLQGATEQGGKETRRYGWSDFQHDFWATLWITRVFHKGVAIAIVLVSCLVAWMMFQGAELTFRTPNGWRSATGERLPDTLRIRPRQAGASLEGTPFTLASKLGGGLRSGGNLTTHDVAFHGQTSAGIPVTFRGTLLLTNAPGVNEIRRQRDAVGGWLSGELIVGTNAPVTIGQPYVPR